MSILYIAFLIYQSLLDDMPGQHTPALGAAVTCALLALLISAPVVWLMTLTFALA